MRNRARSASNEQTHRARSRTPDQCFEQFEYGTIDRSQTANRKFDVNSHLSFLAHRQVASAAAIDAGSNTSRHSAHPIVVARCQDVCADTYVPGPILSVLRRRQQWRRQRFLGAEEQEGADGANGEGSDEGGWVGRPVAEGEVADCIQLNGVYPPRSAAKGSGILR